MTSEQTPWPPSTYGDAFADVYDTWYGPERMPSEDTVAFLAAEAGAGPVLELGIGSGRVALPLADRGFSVTGIDASAAMLDLLRAKPRSSRIAVLLGDFADVAVPATSFSLIYVVFSTLFALPSQEAQLRCFAGVARALRPGGAFVVETIVPTVTWFGNNQHVHVDSIDERGTRLSVSRHDPVTQTIRARQMLFDESGFRTFPVDIRYAWPAELDLMARLNGLEPAGRWTDWNRRPFTAESTRQVSLWRRPG
ncbi:MAG: class I SAM-dependent methyltransferase [Kineosporiaceae bacterium]